MTADAKHVVPEFGLPYAPASIDEVTLTYSVTCPVCGYRFTAPHDAVGEDAVTKGAGLAYAAHFAAKAKEEA